jgi:hypothetical protein
MRGRGPLSRVFLLLLIVVADLRQRLYPQLHLAPRQMPTPPTLISTLPLAHKSHASIRASPFQGHPFELNRGHLIRGALAVLDGPSHVITPGWPDAAREDGAQPRSEWTGQPLAEILKVREANGGGCCAEQRCRAHRHRAAARPCQAWPCVAAHRIVVGL